MLADFYQQLVQSVKAGIPVADTLLVETRGSTPQKAGARMLVFTDGSQVGTLGGGCVEAEVRRKALQLIDRQTPEILSFQLNDNYGWDDGLICGGRMQMLVDPVCSTDQLDYFLRLHEFLASGTPCTEAVTLEASQLESGNETGSRSLFDSSGKLVAHRGIVANPSSLTPSLRDLSTRPRPWVEQGISYLPHLQRCRLLIVGAGHVGQKVAELATQVDFDVWVIDDRQEYCNPERFPHASRLIVGPIDTSLSGLEINDQTYCLIVTRGHNHDEEALYHLAETSARYVGMIGSRRKIKLIFSDLLAEGISREALGRVHAPLGLEIGSQTVPEIAISILAELIAHRNLGGNSVRSRHPDVLEEV